jgi:hypothetical protein
MAAVLWRNRNVLCVGTLPFYPNTATSMIRGLMTLHEAREKSWDLPSAHSTDFLTTSLKGVAWIAKRFNQNINQVDIDAVSPFPPYGLYLAALQQDRMWRETGDLRCFEATNSLAAMLAHFGRRWLNASMSQPISMDAGS